MNEDFVATQKLLVGLLKNKATLLRSKDGVMKMQKEQYELTAEVAVEKGFEYFEKFVARGKNLESVLLEELEPEESGWVVSIGFNGRRQEISEPAAAGTMATLSGFGTKTTTTVREIRHIHLDSQGRFIKIN